jgi:hypothetical protein
VADHERSIAPGEAAASVTRLSSGRRKVYPLEIVPEPSTYALVTMGIISLVAYRRLRRDRFYAGPWRRFAID